MSGRNIEKQCEHANPLRLVHANDAAPEHLISPAFVSYTAASILARISKGENTIYDMTDIGMAAFSVFFMQGPSFLAQQTALARGRGISNFQTLFAMQKIPTDNDIRTMLDPVPPTTLFPMFSQTLATLEAGGGLDAFRRLGGHVLIALDGTEYFCSQKPSCPNCSSRARANGKTEHFHAMVSAAMVAAIMTRPWSRKSSRRLGGVAMSEISLV
jgi:hypothetical protein